MKNYKSKFMFTISDSVHEKPREKLKDRGVCGLNNRELIAILLGTGIKGKSVYEVAQDIMDETNFESDNFTYEKLVKMWGVGHVKACKLVASLELAKRLFINTLVISNSEDVYKLVNDIVNKNQEHFMVITIDGAGGLIKKRTIFKGTVNQSLIHPREVFISVIKDRAAAVILAHNHPSGRLSASREDIEVTRSLVEAGKILGIPVLDHIIVSRKGYFSFYGEKLL